MRSAASNRHAAEKIYYGWIIAGMSAFLAFMVSGVVFGFSIFFPSFESEFGWSRSVIALALSIHMLVYGLGQVVVGRFMNRYGIRRVMIFCALCVGAGTLLMSQVRSVWQLYLIHGVIVGIGYGGTGIVAQSVIAARWFARKLGAALSITMIGMGGGQLVIFPIIERLITSHGWSTTYLIIGSGFSALVLPILLLILKEQPQDIGQNLDGTTPASVDAAAPSERAIGVIEAARSRQFWLLMVSFVGCGVTWSMILGHLVVHAIDLGIPRGTAALGLGLLNALSVFGSIAAGVASDRIGRRIPLSLTYVVRGAAMVYLTVVHDLFGFMIFVAVLGLSFTASIPLTSAYVRDLYGKLSVGAIFGIIAFAHQLGAVFGPVFAGYVYDRTGSYNIAFYVAALTLFSASICVFLIHEFKPDEHPARALAPESA